jgi:U4/U6.U5 tri-snRNP-associated protein 2
MCPPENVIDLETPPNVPRPPSTLYDLIANVTHESTAGTTRDKENTVWKAHVRAGKWNPGSGESGAEGEKWFMLQDLIVEETRRELIFLGETVIQVCSPRFLCCRSLTESETGLI